MFALKFCGDTDPFIEFFGNGYNVYVGGVGLFEQSQPFLVLVEFYEGRGYGVYFSEELVRLSVRPGLSEQPVSVGHLGYLSSSIVDVEVGLEIMASPGKNSGQRVAKDGVLCGPDMNRPCGVCTSMFDDDTLGLIGLQQTIGRSLVKNGVECKLGQSLDFRVEIHIAGFCSLYCLTQTVRVWLFA